MLKLLILVALAGVGAYFTRPDQPMLEAAAKAKVEAPAGAAEGEKGSILDQVAGAVKGWAVGDGKFDDFYVVTHYAANLPGSDYVECWGAFKMTRCEVKNK